VTVFLSSRVLGNFDYNMDMQEFTVVKFILGYSVADCSDNDASTRPLDSLGNVGNGNNCDRPNFDLDPLEKLSLRNLVWSILIARKECERPFD
jgi:hypothetical protein